MAQQLEVITHNLKFLDKLTVELDRKGISTDHLQKLKKDLTKRRQELVASVCGKEAVLNLLIGLA